MKNPTCKLFTTIAFVFVSHLLFATNAYWIVFKDKDTYTSFDPYSYFDAKAIERRVVAGLPLFDFYDLPVNEKYTQQLSLLVDDVYFESRWMNAVAVAVNADKNINNIQQLPFVKEIVPITTSGYLCAKDVELDYDQIHLLRTQTEILGRKAFEKNGITGKGIRIAIFDAGFPGVNEHKAFEHIRKRNGILKTYDFVKKKEDVYGYSSHGTAVLSCIAGKYDTIPTGLAIDAEFLLARTEDAKKEPFSEEVNWLAAAEWADKNGANIINSSLGYTDKRYFPKDMDGKTSFVAKAARIATRKGILVVNAAGNSGSDDWKTIGTPADVDSVLAVGGINPETLYHISFSSFGPTTNGVLKPNVCAFGHVFAASTKGYKTMDGTSFASPLMAGYAACVMQQNPLLNNMAVFKEIEKSASLYPYFDYAHGYGVPNAEYFFSKDIQKSDSFEFVSDKLRVKVSLTKDLETKKGNYLYYRIEDRTGKVKSYYVIDVTSKNPLEVNLKDVEEGGKLVVFYNKTYKEFIR